MAYQVVNTITKPTADIAWWGNVFSSEYQDLVDWEISNLAELLLSSTKEILNPTAILETTVYASEEAYQSAMALKLANTFFIARNAYNASHGITSTKVITEI
jgi:hypothetical protein